jgi:hypothetical protein
LYKIIKTQNMFRICRMHFLKKPNDLFLLRYIHF